MAYRLDYGTGVLRTIERLPRIPDIAMAFIILLAHSQRVRSGTYAQDHS
jgi:hypothetical protein